MPRLAKETSERSRILKELWEICPAANPRGEVGNLSDFFAVINTYLVDNRLAWFRGHADASWSLTPSALRGESLEKRQCAIDILDEFRRIVEPRLAAAPVGEENNVRFQWLQIAQHYGMPTRLLDWTSNAAIALYFACLEPDRDGAVFILVPENLNGESIEVQRVLNPVTDIGRITKYLDLHARETLTRGPKTLAVQPSWNNERIVLQHGCFTLHGSRCFHLDSEQSPGLCHIPILKEAKGSLERELVRIGVGEMYIFPEPEHVCAHLRRSNGLDKRREP